MQKYRVIFHVDLNAFFASCEEARDPSLRGRPLGIGPSSERGILTTANYEARKYGVNSAMPVSEAKRLCPELKIVPVDFALYNEYSETFFDYLSQYTEQLEPASIDEAYLDMTDDLEDQHPKTLAKRMQDELWSRHRLPVSVGIGPNPFLAKMASDLKKPFGITILRKRDVQEKLWPLPIDRLHGIGSKTVPNLRLIGIDTIGDLATFPEVEKLRKFLGNQTEPFMNKARGEDDRRIDPARKDRHQSIGKSKTYEGFLHEHDEMLEALKSLTRRVSERLKEHELAARTLTVQLRTSDYENRSRSVTLEQHTNHFYELFEEVERLFEELHGTEAVHLLGVSTSKLTSQSGLVRQLDIFEASAEEKDEGTLERVLKSINRHYGKDVLKRGVNDE